MTTASVARMSIDPYGPRDQPKRNKWVSRWFWQPRAHWNSRHLSFSVLAIFRKEQNGKHWKIVQISPCEIFPVMIGELWLKTSAIWGGIRPRFDLHFLGLLSCQCHDSKWGWIKHQFLFRTSYFSIIHSIPFVRSSHSTSASTSFTWLLVDRTIISLFDRLIEWLIRASNLVIHTSTCQQFGSRFKPIHYSIEDGDASSSR